MLEKLDDYLRFHESALSLRSSRQQVLASNIANADTPNYKARDVDFSAAMQNALGRGAVAAAGVAANSSANAAPKLDAATTSARHLAAAASTLGVAGTAAKHLSGAVAQESAGTLADGTPLLYRMPAQGAVDANTVDMDVERNQFADNALRYEASITLINAQIKEMMSAIQGAQ